MMQPLNFVFCRGDTFRLYYRHAGCFSRPVLLSAHASAWPRKVGNDDEEKSMEHIFLYFFIGAQLDAFVRAIALPNRKAHLLLHRSDGANTTLCVWLVRGAIYL